MLLIVSPSTVSGGITDTVNRVLVPQFLQLVLARLPVAAEHVVMSDDHFRQPDAPDEVCRVQLRRREARELLREPDHDRQVHSQLAKTFAPLLQCRQQLDGALRGADHLFRVGVERDHHAPARPLPCAGDDPLDDLPVGKVDSIKGPHRHHGIPVEEPRLDRSHKSHRTSAGAIRVPRSWIVCASSTR